MRVYFRPPEYVEYEVVVCPIKAEDFGPGFVGPLAEGEESEALASRFLQPANTHIFFVDVEL